MPAALRRPLCRNLVKDVLRATTGRAASLIAPPPQRFVILTNGRTGSNLLLALLKAHPRIRAHSEIFGEHQLEDRANRRRIRRRGALAHYRNALRPLGLERAIGLKMIYYQLERGYGEKRGVPDVWRVREAMLADPELRFIHLKRRDRLGRLVSNRLALASGRWEGGAYPGAPIEIDPAWARAELDRMEDWERAHDRLLPPERTLEMQYEALAADPQGEMDRVFRFLGLPPRPVRPPTRKQNTRPHRETVANYEELRSVFAGTAHAGLFAE